MCTFYMTKLKSKIAVSQYNFCHLLLIDLRKYRKVFTFKLEELNFKLRMGSINVT